MLFCSGIVRPLAVGLMLMLPVGAAFSHEFWIEPSQYQMEEGAPLEVNLRNGDEFSGFSVAYVKARSPRFDWIIGDRVVPVASRSGDNPALKKNVMQDGLHVLVHQSSVSTIRYTNWEKFQRFADHKDFPNILERHRQRNLPESGFAEAYTRYSKSLISVGSGKGSDAAAGLEIELVALQNPYTDNVSEGLSVVAHYNNQIRADAQIELFEKSPQGNVNISLHRTDRHGVVVLPVKSAHTYLVDMVVLREPAAELAESRKVAWETLWASLTFAVP